VEPQFLSPDTMSLKEVVLIAIFICEMLLPTRYAAYQITSLYAAQLE